jgi:hypothetical protein
LKTNRRTPLILTLIVLIISTAACLGGIFWKPLYRDNPFISSVWLGNDMITLLLAIPLMIIAVILSFNKSRKATLIWAGILWYMIYNYIFYMYGTSFNKLFLLYVLIVILSSVAFILLFIDLSKDSKIRDVFQNTKLPLKRIIGFMIFFAGFIGLMWVSTSILFIFTNEVPLGIIQSGHSTAVVFATDLTFLVSPLIMGVILLWKRESSGYILSTIIMVKSLLYPFVLLAGGILAYKRTGIWDSFTPAYLVLGLGCYLCLFSLLKGLSNTPVPDKNSKKEPPAGDS